MIKKIRNFKFATNNSQAGMTLLELLVVLGIFAILATVSIFNYGGLQAKINITNLTDDVALQVVGAQNASLSGLLPAVGQAFSATWKPSYGVYFSSSAVTDSQGGDNKDFIYFVDLNQNQQYDYSGANSCVAPLTSECVSKYTITNNNYISRMDVFYTNGTDSTGTAGLTNLTITFARPNSGAFFKASPSFNVSLTVDHVQITTTNKVGSVTSNIDLYPSGRVQLN